MMALVVSADGTGSPVLPGKLRLYIVCTGSRRRREIGSPPGYRGKLSDIIMRMRVIVRLLLVDRIVYTIQSLLAVSPYEC